VVHAKAVLNPRGRLLLARRVVDEGRINAPVRLGRSSVYRALVMPPPELPTKVRSVDAEAVEHVDGAACALVEGERACECLTLAVARRVDQDHPMPCGEVLGLRRPHVARHHQAGPEQDRVSVTSSAYRDLAERGVDRAAFQGSFLAEKHLCRSGPAQLAWYCYRVQARGGVRNPVNAASRSSAKWRGVRSSNMGPITCAPIGNPSGDWSMGTTVAGSPGLVAIPAHTS
jgi:hypothetical protein